MSESQSAGAQSASTWGARPSLLEVGELAEAIENDQLQLVYQPIVDLGAQRVVGAEALLRWERPGGDNVPAERLVRFAEACGLSRQLTWWVVGTALEDASEWRRRGHQIDLSVNVSPDQASHPHRVATLLAHLDARGFEPAHLTIEITETTVMRDPTGVKGTLNLLRDAGVRVALDDFGTGESTLSRLQDLPVSELKIDKRFVARAIEHPTSARLVNFATMLGRGLGLTVVAEGIEDAATFDLVERCRVDRVQGYLFSKPVHKEKLVGAAEDIARNLRAPVAASDDLSEPMDASAARSEHSGAVSRVIGSSGQSRPGR